MSSTLLKIVYLQRDTFGCGKTVNRLLLIGDWYDPVAEKFKVGN